MKETIIDATATTTTEPTATQDTPPPNNDAITTAPVENLSKETPEAMQNETIVPKENPEKEGNSTSTTATVVAKVVELPTL
eukprot:11167378-Ditylum_brightwellii.AAC.1